MEAESGKYLEERFPSADKRPRASALALARAVLFM